MLGFGNRRPQQSSALVPQQPEGETPGGNTQTAELQRLDQDPHQGYSVLETVDGEGMVLIGKGTTVSGEIGNCSKVEIQGHLEGSLVADSVVVREGGSVKGGLHAGHAEVHGVVDGEVIVEQLLDVRSTGRVVGELSYGKLSVSVGGDIVGAIKGPEPPPQPQAQHTPPPPNRGMNGHASYSALEGHRAQPPPITGH